MHPKFLEGGMLAKVYYNEYYPHMIQSLEYGQLCDLLTLRSEGLIVQNRNTRALEITQLGYSRLVYLNG